ncbi:MAG: ABC transporter permease [Candidatus Acidiferrales bacterium]
MDLNAYPHLDNLGADLRDAWRGLRRDPGFSVVAISIVAAMLSVNLMLFAFLDAFFLRPLPIAGAERHFELSVRDEHGRIERRWPLAQVENFIASHAGVLEAGYAFAERRVIVGSGEDAKRSYVEVVSPSYFDLLKPPLARGRVPRADSSGSPEPAILLSHTGWKRLTGSDPNALGRTLLVDGVSLTITGVLAENAGGLEPVTPDFWMLAGAADRTSRAAAVAEYSIGGVLREGITVEQAAAALAPAADALHPGTTPSARGSVLIELRPTFLRERGELQPLALALLFLFGLVTLTAGANLTSLYLARAVVRRRDLGIRAALGASRVRLIRHILTESLLVAGAAALVAWAVSAFSIAALQGVVFGIVSDAGMSMRPIEVDGRIAVAGLLLAAVMGIGCGLAPALHTTHGALEVALRRDSLWLAGRVSAGRLRGALVVLQVALSLPLLVGAGILVRTAATAAHFDPGFGLDGLIDLRADSPSPRLLAHLRELPGVAAVSTAACTPLTGPLRRIPARVNNAVVRVGTNQVNEDYFATFAIRVIGGRNFHPHETAHRAPVAIVSQAAAQRLFPNANALGRTVDLKKSGAEDQFVAHEIVGVVSDVANGFFFEGRDAVYTPASLEAGAPEILVRLERYSSAELIRLRTACADVGAFCEPHTLRKILGLQSVPFLVGGQVASSLGLLALGLACLGLYGLARFTVVQRAREFGVRFVLGATRAQILGHVLAESSRRSGLGIAIGLPVSLGLSALLASLVPFLESFDLVAYLLVPLTLIACSLLATLFPALRAAAIDPISAIREE